MPRGLTMTTLVVGAPVLETGAATLAQLGRSVARDSPWLLS
jgi:hypothetical protein